MISNLIAPKAISRNLKTAISEHLPPFTIIFHVFGNILCTPTNKSNTCERDYCIFKKENFILNFP